MTNICIDAAQISETRHVFGTSGSEIRGPDLLLDVTSGINKDRLSGVILVQAAINLETAMADLHTFFQRQPRPLRDSQYFAKMGSWGRRNRLPVSAKARLTVA